LLLNNIYNTKTRNTHTHTHTHTYTHTHTRARARAHTCTRVHSLTHSLPKKVVCPKNLGKISNHNLINNEDKICLKM